MRRPHPAGIVGRALVAFGAGLYILSLFLDLFQRSTGSQWDFYERIDVIALLLALVAVVLLATSLFAAEELQLFLVGVIGGYLAGFGVPDLIEFREEAGGIAVGGYLAALGSALVIGGALIALLVKQEEELAFLPQVTPAAETPPEPAGPTAGWYADPSGQARLRYWDGRQWTEQTQE